MICGLSGGKEMGMCLLFLEYCVLNVFGLYLFFCLLVFFLFEDFGLFFFVIFFLCLVRFGNLGIKIWIELLVVIVRLLLYEN